MRAARLCREPQKAAARAERCLLTKPAPGQLYGPHSSVLAGDAHPVQAVLPKLASEFPCPPCCPGLPGCPGFSRTAPPAHGCDPARIPCRVLEPHQCEDHASQLQCKCSVLPAVSWCVGAGHCLPWDTPDSSVGEQSQTLSSCSGPETLISGMSYGTDHVFPCCSI